MNTYYNINEVVRLRDEEKLQWKLIAERLNANILTIRKTYKMIKEGLTYSEVNPNNVKLLRERGLTRKYKAVLDRGGKCERCGYNKNISALDFHHVNPSEKSFALDLRAFSNRNWNILQLEINKCILLCANCHREIHHPNLSFTNLDNYINYNRLENIECKKEPNRCLVCGKVIGRKATLCEECNSYKLRKVERPSREELKLLIRTKTFVSVGKIFGVTNKSIEKWCIFYNLPHKKLEIIKISDIDWENI